MLTDEAQRSHQARSGDKDTIKMRKTFDGGHGAKHMFYEGEYGGLGCKASDRGLGAKSFAKNVTSFHMFVDLIHFMVWDGNCFEISRSLGNPLMHAVEEHTLC